MVGDFLPTTAATLQATVRKMREVFATHGLPDEIVTDNGTHFTGTEFQRFMAQNGIRHIKITPYHLSSNGLAEWAVQVFKDAMKKLAATPVARCGNEANTIPFSVLHNTACNNGDCSG